MATTAAATKSQCGTTVLGGITSTGATLASSAEKPLPISDERHHDQRVGQQVSHVEYMAPGQQRVPLGRADLLDDEHGEHEAQDHWPGKLQLRCVDRRD